MSVNDTKHGHGIRYIKKTQLNKYTLYLNNPLSGNLPPQIGK